MFLRGLLKSTQLTKNALLPGKSIVTPSIIVPSTQYPFTSFSSAKYSTKKSRRNQKRNSAPKTWNAVYVNSAGNQRKFPILSFDEEFDPHLETRVSNLLNRKEKHPIIEGFDILNGYMDVYDDTMDQINIIDRELKKINSRNPNKDVYVRKQTKQKDRPANIKKYVKPVAVCWDDGLNKINLLSRMWAKLIQNGKLNPKSDFMRDINKNYPIWIFDKNYKSCPHHYLWSEIRKWNKRYDVSLFSVMMLLRSTQQLRVSDYSVANHHLLVNRNSLIDDLQSDRRIIEFLVDEVENNI